MRRGLAGCLCAVLSAPLFTLRRLRPTRGPFARFMQQVCGLPEVALEPHEGERAGELAQVHVAYASDPPNFPGLLGSMLSLSRHLREPRACHLHLLVRAEHLRAAEELLACFRRELAEPARTPAVVLHELRPLPAVVAKFISSIQWRQRWERVHSEAFAKIYLSTYLPAVPRVLWLDHDTIVKTSIEPLYRMRMTRALAGAPMMFTLEDYLARRGVRLPGVSGRLRNASAPAFNDGVLVLDLRRWASEGVAAEFEAWAALLTGLNVSSRQADKEQLVLNLALQDGYDALDWRWNAQDVAWGPRVPQCYVDQARVLHWAGHFKPWDAPWFKPSVQGSEVFGGYAPRLHCGALRSGPNRWADYSLLSWGV